MSVAPTSYTHTPVLAKPFVTWLAGDRLTGRFVDATFGRGGHCALLLSRLEPEGKVMAFDRDPEAIAHGQALAEADRRLHLIAAPFGQMAEHLDSAGWGQVDGIGFDLGVSSPQFDDAARGFSFRNAGPLDMRMDCLNDEPLSERLNELGEGKLTTILRDYGEERYARRIAAALLKARESGQLKSTRDLENICFHAVPAVARHGSTHPATRTFQALRIWINDEYGQLDTALNRAIGRLNVGGRLVVISFHSGEDRRVRDRIELEVRGCTCPPAFPVCVCGKKPTMRWLVKKPLRAANDELEQNPRSRSAMMRVAEKIA